VKYTVGVDFGTESGRALLVEVDTGREVATSVYRYKNGVVDRQLPIPGPPISLEPDWALQDPDDYVRTLATTVPAVLADSGVDPADVIGVGVDFTSCTILPVTAAGDPLCRSERFRRDPHSWVKLWKHHAAQPEADRINELARDRDEPWLGRYGGRISSEWFFAKTLQILDESPGVYAAADRIIEAADWIVWQLTGHEVRNACTAGYKAIWSKRDGFVGNDFLGALDPRLRNVVDEKMSRDLRPVATPAGLVSKDASRLTGLRPGTPVAVANVDAHVSVPACGVTTPGRLVAIMGTSICHIVLDDREVEVEGMCGVVEDGVLPGLFGYEAGQPAVGDMLGWFVDQAVPPSYHERARAAGVTVHEVLEADATRLRPGESGLLALDWWNGNRSILVDAGLSGLLVGATLATRASDIYRALIEAAAFGTRAIIEAFRAGGVQVGEIVACGGLPDRNRLLMQTFADVTGRSISVASSGQTPALGAAITAAVAAGSDAGGHGCIDDAVAAMAHIAPIPYQPNPAWTSIYSDLYAEYVRLHDLFGRGHDAAMGNLRVLRDRARLMAV